uniref:Tripartite motif containing 40 n=1 Tax=Loxodonta africana TaxID=9785 RepID=G3TB61_LOXAF
MVPLQEDSREEGLCSICQEHLKEAVRTDCGHLFCRVCLALYLKDCALKAVCPVCRAPCSEKVLGEGYICQSHQERVSLFCEESCLLLCVKCQECPEHQSHRELAIEEAISHYKERLSRRCRKLRKDLGELQRLKAQEEDKQQIPQQQLDQLEDKPAEKARILDISRAITQHSNLITDLERTAKQLGANMLKDIRDLLNRSAPQKLEGIYPELEKRANGSPPHPSSAA